jgi:hypothetical protein
MRREYVEYVDGEILSIEVGAFAELMSEKSERGLRTRAMWVQEPPYKAIFLALALLAVGTSLLIFGFMILTGHVDAGERIFRVCLLPRITSSLCRSMFFQVLYQALFLYPKLFDKV